MRDGTRFTLWGCALFSMCGLCMELLFTGASAWWSGSFRGHVSLLMVPVYCFAFLALGPLLGLLERLGLQHPLARMPFLVTGVYATEWSFGALYLAVGLEPWRYAHGWASDFSNGHVTLYYLPAWAFVALVAVPVWNGVRRVAPALDAAARAERAGAPRSGDARP